MPPGVPERLSGLPGGFCLAVFAVAFSGRAFLHSLGFLWHGFGFLTGCINFVKRYRHICRRRANVKSMASVPLA